MAMDNILMTQDAQDKTKYVGPRLCQYIIWNLENKEEMTSDILQNGKINPDVAIESIALMSGFAKKNLPATEAQETFRMYAETIESNIDVKHAKKVKRYIEGSLQYLTS